VESCSKYDNEPSGSLKRVEILGQMAQLAASQEGLKSQVFPHTVIEKGKKKLYGLSC
jgi:hypothetical protein